MGYTHYWTLNKEVVIPEITQQRIRVYLDYLQNEKGIVTSGDGCEEVIISDTLIRFNGKPGEDYETFYFMSIPDTNFCKTGRCPYDGAVCGVLLILLAAFDENTLSISSDGSFYENPAWFDAKDYCGWMSAVQWVWEALVGTNKWHPNFFHQAVTKLISSLA